ncbi:hypothetical protein CSW98_17415 [Vibrio sp. HA2012]|nr:hypothetical protein CSW98_17415 [Vibrio sp. HA2012]
MTAAPNRTSHADQDDNMNERWHKTQRHRYFNQLNLFRYVHKAVSHWVSKAHFASAKVYSRNGCKPEKFAERRNAASP